MEKLISDLQPYLSLISAIISLAVLGFIIKLALLIKQSYSAKAEVLVGQKELVEERLKSSEKDLERTEKWYEREIERFKLQLSEILDKENITVSNLSTDFSLTDLKDDIKTIIKSVLSDMISIEKSLKEETNQEVNDPKWYLEMAKGFTASDKWIEAATYYNKYLAIKSDDWEVHFLRGVAYVNSRENDQTNLLALRSYNEAIALKPNKINNNMLARLFAYKGAVLKRLKRLDEAENDLLFAQKFATSFYEVNDIKYNLACIYSMKGERESLFKVLNQIKKHPMILGAIHSHIDDYFKNFQKDKEFLKLLNF